MRFLFAERHLMHAERTAVLVALVYSFIIEKCSYTQKENGQQS